MYEPLLVSTTLFLAWGWLGAFWVAGWFVLSLVRQSIDKRDRAFLKGVPWDALPEAEHDRVSRHWRRTRWQGLKHYLVGLLILGAAWLATVALLNPGG